MVMVKEIEEMRGDEMVQQMLLSSKKIYGFPTLEGSKGLCQATLHFNYTPYFIFISIFS